MEIVALVALQLGNCAQDSDGICTKPAAQGFRQEELMAFPAKPSLLQSRFMPLLLELELAARLNEFQFPGFITQPGAGGRGDLWLHQNLSGFLRVPVNWSSALHSALLHAPFSGPWHFPTFSLDPSPRQLVVSSSRPVVVPCKYNTAPGKQPDIRWKKDGLLLDLPSPGRRLLGNGSLVVEGEDGGSYQCVASLPGIGTLLSTVTKVNPAGE